MTATTTYKRRRGDVLLVGFVFTDESGQKLRPALVVSSASYHRSRQEAIIVAITSNLGRQLVGDHRIEGWKQAGLLHPSLATGVVRTIAATMIHRRLGSLRTPDLTAVSNNLRVSLGL